MMKICGAAVAGVLALMNWSNPASANEPRETVIRIAVRNLGTRGVIGDVMAIANPISFTFSELWETPAYRPGVQGGAYGHIILIDRTYGEIKGLRTVRGLQRYRVMWERMPLYMRQAIWNQGFIATRWGAIRPYVWDRYARKILTDRDWILSQYNARPSAQDLNACAYDCDLDACTKSSTPEQGLKLHLLCVEHYDYRPSYLGVQTAP